MYSLYSQNIVKLHVTSPLTSIVLPQQKTMIEEVVVVVVIVVIDKGRSGETQNSCVSLRRLLLVPRQMPSNSQHAT